MSTKEALEANEEDPVRLWAEIWRLRAAVAGPQGYASWQEAATAERVRRVKAERALAEQQAEPKQDKEQEAFERWLLKARPSGDCEAVQSQWLESHERAQFIDEQAEPSADAEREAFERWQSQAGSWPMAVERSGDGYKLAQTQAAWLAWRAAWKAARSQQ